MFKKGEQNQSWSDAQSKNNDSINAIILNLIIPLFDVEFKSRNRQKAHHTKKDEKLSSQNNK